LLDNQRLEGGGQSLAESSIGHLPEFEERRDHGAGLMFRTSLYSIFRFIILFGVSAVYFMFLG
jgi:hypothetical protein